MKQKILDFAIAGLATIGAGCALILYFTLPLVLVAAAIHIIFF